MYPAVLYYFISLVQNISYGEYYQLSRQADKTIYQKNLTESINYFEFALLPRVNESNKEMMSLMWHIIEPPIFQLHIYHV